MRQWQYRDFLQCCSIISGSVLVVHLAGSSMERYVHGPNLDGDEIPYTSGQSMAFFIALEHSQVRSPLWNWISVVLTREHAPVLPGVSVLSSLGAWYSLVPYKVPSAIRTISPILVYLLICSPRKTKIESMTQIKSVATPKAKCVVSSFQQLDGKHLPLKVLVDLTTSEAAMHRPGMAGFQTRSNGMHWKHITKTFPNIRRVKRAIVARSTLRIAS